MNAPLLSVAHAEKAFGAGPRRTAALDDVSFTVDKGERVALLGRNGAGKSTLLRGVGALVQLDSGAIRIGGLDPARPRRALAGGGITLLGGRRVFWRAKP